MKPVLFDDCFIDTELGGTGNDSFYPATLNYNVIPWMVQIFTL